MSDFGPGAAHSTAAGAAYGCCSPRPDFLIVGAPKAGTTALHAALAQHPELFLPAVKEPKYFLCGDQPPPTQRGPGDAHSAREWVWRRGDYEALFAPAPPGTLRGESTPLYLADDRAHERIRQAVPDVKLIAVLRDPIERAYSNWTHLWSDGLEPIGDFVAACDTEGQRAADGWAPFWRYLGLGHYGEQVSHLLELFPSEQLYLLRYRDLVERPKESLDRICTFLGVEPGWVAAAPPENVSTWVADTRLNSVLRQTVRAGARLGAHVPPEMWRSASRPLLAVLRRGEGNRPELCPADRARLLERVADDIRLLERVTGECYQDWLGERGRDTYSVRKSWAPPEAATS
jgi:hypothetical protein